MKTTLYQLMRDHGDRQAEVAKVLGVSESTFNLKLSGKRDFKVSEAKCLAKRYDLTPEEICEVFFDD